MYIVSYSERKLTLEMTFRAKTDVKMRRRNDVSTLRYARSFERLQLRTSGLKTTNIIVSLRHLIQFATYTVYKTYKCKENHQRNPIGSINRKDSPGINQLK